MLAFVASEKRAPLWALAAPVVYLFACALAVRAVFYDDAEAGVSALLLAVGLIPAFAIPAIFSTRRALLALTDAGVTVDGRLQKVDDARLEHADRGTGILHLVVRSGETRSFVVDRYKDAERLIARLPPVSVPSGALAA
jgi:hypothetical protein